MIQRVRPCILFLIALLLTVETSGQKLASFDTNGDGLLSAPELEAYFLKTYKKQLFDADKNKDLQIDSSEYTLQIQTFMEDIKRILGIKSTYTLDEINRIYPVQPKFTAAGILLRETAEDISPSTSAKAISKVKPAVFSFTRDFSAQTNTFIAKGAVMRPFKINAHFFLAPSITFNRTVSKDTTKAANTLVPKIGFYFNLSKDKPRVIQAHLVRILANVATDFDFKSSQVGVEAEWEPVFKNVAGLGIYYLISESIPIEYRLQFFTHTEAGYVFNKGNKENLESSSTYLRTGGKIGVDFRLFETIGLSGGLRYLYGLAGVPQHSRYWTASAEYTIGPSGNIGLKIDYQKGNVPLTSEEVNNIVVGFAVRL